VSSIFGRTFFCLPYDASEVDLCLRRRSRLLADRYVIANLATLPAAISTEAAHEPMASDNSKSSPPGRGTSHEWDGPSGVVRSQSA
jgi:hypothetical protein